MSYTFPGKLSAKLPLIMARSRNTRSAHHLAESLRPQTFRPSSLTPAPLLLALACYNKSMKRFVSVIAITALILVGLAAATFFGIGYYLSPQDHLAKADAIVAISGGETAARTTEAVRLYQAGWAPIVIFSGAAADPHGPSNAKAMAASALTQGVPDTAIQLDETSLDTRQNAANVTGLIHTADYHSIILVTSPYHQRRASLVFHRALGKNFTLINHSSYDQNWRRSYWWATPYSQHLTLSELQKIAYELASQKASP